MEPKELTDIEDIRTFMIVSGYNQKIIDRMEDYDIVNLFDYAKERVSTSLQIQLYQQN